MLVALATGCSRPQTDASGSANSSQADTAGQDLAEPRPINVIYPSAGALFPPEIATPTFRWQDDNPNCDAWRIEIWFQDEARIGQKNGLVRQWARRGTRPTRMQPG